MSKVTNIDTAQADSRGIDNAKTLQLRPTSESNSSNELDGMSKSEASQVFQISRNTINLWLQRKATTGDYQALPNQPLGNGDKITDWEKFGKFVEVNGDKTQVEMAKLWSVEIKEISARTISRALRKIGFTRKKNLWLSRTR